MAKKTNLQMEATNPGVQTTITNNGCQCNRHCSPSCKLDLCHYFNRFMAKPPKWQRRLGASLKCAHQLVFGGCPRYVGVVSARNSFETTNQKRRSKTTRTGVASKRVDVLQKTTAKRGTNSKKRDSAICASSTLVSLNGHKAG